MIRRVVFWSFSNSLKRKPFLVIIQTFWKNPIICSTGLETGCKLVLFVLTKWEVSNQHHVSRYRDMKKVLGLILPTKKSTAAVSCSPVTVRLGWVWLVSETTGKLGRAWVGDGICAWGFVVVVMWGCNVVGDLKFACVYYLLTLI